jgi:hypothetical protein
MKLAARPLYLAFLEKIAQGNRITDCFNQSVALASSDGKIENNVCAGFPNEKALLPTGV